MLCRRWLWSMWGEREFWLEDWPLPPTYSPKALHATSMTQDLRPTARSDCVAPWYKLATREETSSWGDDCGITKRQNTGKLQKLIRWMDQRKKIEQKKREYAWRLVYGVTECWTSARRRVGPHKRDRPNRGAYLHEARSVTGLNCGQKKLFTARNTNYSVCW